jgi:hypothetical protein
MSGPGEGKVTGLVERISWGQIGDHDIGRRYCTTTSGWRSVF